MSLWGAGRFDSCSEAEWLGITATIIPCAPFPLRRSGRHGKWRGKLSGTAWETAAAQLFFFFFSLTYKKKNSSVCVSRNEKFKENVADGLCGVVVK